MGYARWDTHDWSRFAARTARRTTAQIFDRRRIDPTLDPKGIDLRESRDSEKNPASTALVVGLDVTGSMGMLADVLAREGLGTLVQSVLDRKPVTDPHIMVMGIGDVECDQAPLQVTQFEADIRIAEQLSRIWLEKGGGGNHYESYALAWYFAATHTAIDCFEKRNKNGYLFTVGDEMPTPGLAGRDVARALGGGPAQDLPAHQLLAMASRMYEVFHVVVEEGSYASHDPDGVVAAWQEVIGQRTIRLSDHRNLAEVIVSTIEVAEGRDPAAVARSWGGRTADVVDRAVRTMTTRGRGGRGPTFH